MARVRVRVRVRARVRPIGSLTLRVNHICSKGRPYAPTGPLFLVDGEGGLPAQGLKHL